MRSSDFAQIQAFIEVARRSSFSAAARELGVSTSAVSQAVKQLEQNLGVPLLTRTTRSVAATEAGRTLLERAGPAFEETRAALRELTAAPGETLGKLRITVPRPALRWVIEPVVPVFHARHPRVDVEVVVHDWTVDIVTERYDAGVRFTGTTERDMVEVPLTAPFRFIVVASPAYLARAGVPERPEDLLQHDCIGFRYPGTGEHYAWAFEQGSRAWRVPVRATLISNEPSLRLRLAQEGVGLLYSDELSVSDALEEGSLVPVLEPYARHIPGFCIYYPSRSQRSPALRDFVQVAREVVGAAPG